MKLKPLFTKAFPNKFEEECLLLLKKINLVRKYNDSDSFIVNLNGEQLHLPSRIYFEEVIEKNLNRFLIDNMCAFANENPNYMHLTKQRMASYWNCYYRYKFEDKEDYTGFKVFEKLGL